MHLTIAALAALVAQPAMAAPTAPVSRDAHKADFRSFGVAGCVDENQGVWTLLASDSGVCQSFVAPVGSILVASDDCALYLYTDAQCGTDGTRAPTGTCADGDWQSFQLVC